MNTASPIPGTGGGTIRVIRQLSGLSLRDTARRAGISASDLSALETGRRPLNPAVVCRIADTLASGGLD